MRAASCSAHRIVSSTRTHVSLSMNSPAREQKKVFGRNCVFVQPIQPSTSSRSSGSAIRSRKARNSSASIRAGKGRHPYRFPNKTMKFGLFPRSLAALDLAQTDLHGPLVKPGFLTDAPSEINRLKTRAEARADLREFRKRPTGRRERVPLFLEILKGRD